ncbi:hypothetical protein RJT34_25389 [Clitoria ternatea]|uniref:Uncharacterized protein n=1 Tax=Clitoria ternatea TaxID=43366 RepID=A0AAN9FSH2_CLITE
MSSRNHKVHNANIPDPLHTLQQAQKLIQEYLIANKEECKQVRRQQLGSDITTWRPPLEGFYKENVDASWVNHLQQASMGLILRDQQGDLKFGETRRDQFQAIGFTCTKRADNGAAHMVAKLDQENNLASRWWLHPPLLLRNILTEDKRRIPPSMRPVPPPVREVDDHIRFSSLHRYQLHKAGELSLPSATTFPIQPNSNPPLFS